MDLFESSLSLGNDLSRAPLAERMRPQTLEEVVGQEHILGEGKLLRRLITLDQWPSIIFYGPAGTGKTTLAKLIARSTKSLFVQVNAVTSNLAELRSILDEAKKNRQYYAKKTILFIDEIHRFSKSQQDVLMPFSENGQIVLIGATTHNPSFSLNAPILSRAMIFELKTLTDNHLISIMENSVRDDRSGFKDKNIVLDHEALTFIARHSEGDARKALNTLEIAILSTTQQDSTQKIYVTLEVAENSCQKRLVRYDHDEDYHYDTISAYIKSMRGCDANAAVYWLAKMLYAGEDPRFIARRMMIFSSEDIGNADPRALLMAQAAMQAVETIGMPEVQIILSHVTTYLSLAPKSNASYIAIQEALEDVKNGVVQQVPSHLRDAHYSGAKQMNHGTHYLYPHDAKQNPKLKKALSSQKYLETPKIYYRPTDSGYEKNLKTPK